MHPSTLGLRVDTLWNRPVAVGVRSGMIRFLRKTVDSFRRARALLVRLKAPSQPLPGGRQRWIEDSMEWLIGEFGRDVLLRPIVVPTEVIPAGYDGSVLEARSLCERIARRMDVPPERIDLTFDLTTEGPKRDAGKGRLRISRERSGEWARGEERNRIRLAPELMADPVALVAVFAHEVGHELLLGGRRVAVTRPDQEPLTDLLTVFYGLGIFTANASFEVRPHPSGRGKQPLARGYLREDALAQSMAYYAQLRGERHPAWRKHLDRPVRVVV